ncbi:MAG: hypothetical protein NW226_17245 [Microscillaceae bacterium]|nr:hypothetical protein [Microscillaceae bacterium]
MKKQEVLDTLDSFPEEFKLDDLIEKLILIDKIQEAQKDIAEGNVYSLEETKAFFEHKWSK